MALNKILEKLKTTDVEFTAYFVKGSIIKKITISNIERIVGTNRLFNENNRGFPFHYYTISKHGKKNIIRTLYVTCRDYNREERLECHEDPWACGNTVSIFLDKDEAYRFSIHKIEEEKRKLNKKIVNLQEQWNQL